MMTSEPICSVALDVTPQADQSFGKGVRAFTFYAVSTHLRRPYNGRLHFYETVNFDGHVNHGELYKRLQEAAANAALAVFEGRGKEFASELVQAIGPVGGLEPYACHTIY